MFEKLKNLLAPNTPPPAPAPFALSQDLEKPLREFGSAHGWNYRETLDVLFSLALETLGPRDEVAWSDDDFQELCESLCTAIVLPHAPPMMRIRGFRITGPGARDDEFRATGLGRVALAARRLREYPSDVAVRCPLGRGPTVALVRHLTFLEAPPREGVTVSEAAGFWVSNLAPGARDVFEETCRDARRKYQSELPDYVDLTYIALIDPSGLEDNIKSAVALHPETPDSNILRRRLRRRGA